MLMMMRPLSTHTSLSTPTNHNNTGCTSTNSTCSISLTPTTTCNPFCFPPLALPLPPLPHSHQHQQHHQSSSSDHHQQDHHHHQANNNNHQHHQQQQSGCVGGGGGASVRLGLTSDLSMEFNKTANDAFVTCNSDHQNNNNSNNKSSSNYFMAADLHTHINNNSNHGGSSSSSHPYSSDSLKAKIMAHPYYPRLLTAYVNCQKVGAPPAVVARLEEALGATEMVRTTGYIGEDPPLDQFMEAYCEMLAKYEQELTKPFKEAMIFLSRIECQFKALALSSSNNNNNGGAAANNVCSSSGPLGAADLSLSGADGNQGNESSDEDIDVNTNYIDPQAEDGELKCQLLRKYSGYLGSLKQEFMKKKKKGKLPKEARQQLLDWWSRHYKWPYPSENQKMQLAASTGLDPKQINNWFINQRKRHWKPSEDMQYVVMDPASHSHHYYMDNVLGNPFPMDVSAALL